MLNNHKIIQIYYNSWKMWKLKEISKEIFQENYYKDIPLLNKNINNILNNQNNNVQNNKTNRRNMNKKQIIYLNQTY